MTIEEGNKSIAEFMELEKATRLSMSGQYRCYIFTDEVYDRISNDFKYHWPSVKLKYHSSWDWLMPVVEKIEILNGCPYRVVITSSLCYITDKSKHGTPEVVRSANGDRLKNAYNAVIKFIQWYNENKKP